MPRLENIPLFEMKSWPPPLENLRVSGKMTEWNFKI